MPAFDTLVEFILPIIELFAYGTPGETKYRCVPTDLVSIGLQLHGTNRSCLAMLTSVAQIPASLDGGCSWRHVCAIVLGQA